MLARRAELLAAPEQQAETSLRQETVMIFRLAADRFALPLAELLQVLPHSKLAAVPGAPAEVAGLIQIRGEVRPIYHLKQLLGLPAATADGRSVVLMLRHPAGEFGILVEAVEEVRSVPESARRPGAPAKGHAGWMTEDLVPVLSVELLLGEK